MQLPLGRFVRFSLVWFATLCVFISLKADEHLVLRSQTGVSRGYTTTPQELAEISRKAEDGLEPYASAVEAVLREAQKRWEYRIDAVEGCGGADSPGWITGQKGISRLYARALAYHLTGDQRYAEEVVIILERIMSEAIQISIQADQCRLNFSWGTPELVASADLIEAYWHEQTCRGPAGTSYEDKAIIAGNCKHLFQNWLVKNPYYLVSLTAEEAQNNWGAAATNTLAHIADYLWDRPEITLYHRTPTQINNSEDILMSPAEAFVYANRLALDRMNGYRVEYRSNRSCDTLAGAQQQQGLEPIKSQITPDGIIPEDARREQYCNITAYDGNYQNYPQVHLGNNIQQCELMLRRGDPACYDNIDLLDIPDFEFESPDGTTLITHLYPRRGSIERAINAIIIDSNTEWRHDSALELAFRYYSSQNGGNLDYTVWFQQLDRPSACDQDVCFGTLTHGFSPSETLRPGVVVEAP